MIVSGRPSKKPWIASSVSSFQKCASARKILCSSKRLRRFWFVGSASKGKARSPSPSTVRRSASSVDRRGRRLLDDLRVRRVGAAGLAVVAAGRARQAVGAVDGRPVFVGRRPVLGLVAEVADGLVGGAAGDPVPVLAVELAEALEAALLGGRDAVALGDVPAAAAVHDDGGAVFGGGRRGGAEREERDELEGRHVFFGE